MQLEPKGVPPKDGRKIKLQMPSGNWITGYWDGHKWCGPSGWIEGTPKDWVELPGMNASEVRGTEYVVLGYATLQASLPPNPADGAEMVVYRDSDGQLWVRRRTEFEDGRFEEI